MQGTGILRLAGTAFGLTFKITQDSGIGSDHEGSRVNAFSMMVFPYLFPDGFRSDAQSRGGVRCSSLGRHL